MNVRGADVRPMVTAGSVRWARQIVSADTGSMKRAAARHQRRRMKAALSQAHLMHDLEEIDVLPRTTELDSWDVC